MDLCRSGRLPPPREPIPLPFDEVDPLLTMRLVCRFPTGSGEVVWERRAAAAAADESEDVDFVVWRNADMAAVVALEVVF